MHRVLLAVLKLDAASFRIVGFSDASFANRRELSTQLGYIIFLVDGDSNSVPIEFKSYRSRRITYSTMAEKVIAFANISDSAVTLRKVVERLLHRRVALHPLTDCTCTLNIISKGSRTSEKHLITEITPACEQFRISEVSDIRW